MTVPKKIKRVIISLAVGTFFTFGYLLVVAIFIFVYYADRPRYAVLNVIPYWPLQLPELVYFAMGGDPYSHNRAVSWLLTLANIPLYALLTYWLMLIVDVLRGKRLCRWQ